MARTRSRVGPQSSKAAPRLDVDALLDDRSVGIIVCCGSGGVGKTTVSAALALRAAERGRTVVVLTIDPARRLAQAMGIEALDNTPPSRSALDFLDAPERLSSFLDGRFIKLLLTPTRGPARMMSAGFGIVTNA